VARTPSSCLTGSRRPALVRLFKLVGAMQRWFKRLRGGALQGTKPVSARNCEGECKSNHDTSSKSTRCEPTGSILTRSLSHPTTILFLVTHSNYTRNHRFRSNIISSPSPGSDVAVLPEPSHALLQCPPRVEKVDPLFDELSCDVRADESRRSRDQCSHVCQTSSARFIWRSVKYPL